jgi:hypothetical protein
LKKIELSGLTNEQQKEILVEAKVLAKLNHVNIIK